AAPAWGTAAHALRVAPGTSTHAAAVSRRPNGTRRLAATRQPRGLHSTRPQRTGRRPRRRGCGRALPGRGATSDVRRARPRGCLAPPLRRARGIPVPDPAGRLRRLSQRTGVGAPSPQLPRADLRLLTDRYPMDVEQDGKLGANLVTISALGLLRLGAEDFR